MNDTQIVMAIVFALILLGFGAFVAEDTPLMDVLLILTVIVAMFGMLWVAGL